ncbi:MAG: hypothetical protein NVS2B7_34020 [Herpetosiphon sp.]
MELAVTVNGKSYRHDVSPRLLLVHYLRDYLNLTGTHVGCDTSQCGACVVHLDGQSVKSCTLLAIQTNGAQVKTIEGLANGDEYHPMQVGFWEKHGLQCGFCTPGMIMSAASLLDQIPHPDETQIRHALEGNFCRCTGYENIIKSVQHAAAHMNGAASNGNSAAMHREAKPETPETAGEISHPRRDENSPTEPETVGDWTAENAGVNKDAPTQQGGN